MGSFLDLVKSRRSVRTFDGRPVDADLLKQLKDYGETLSNPYNIPITLGFFAAKDYDLSSPVLSGAETYVTAKVAVGANADVAYGYSFQQFLMKAHEQGLGTVWIGGTMPREKFEAAAALASNEVMPCVSPLGYTAKIGVKEALMRKGVKADSRFDFGKLFFKDSFDTPLTEAEADEKKICEALEAVRWAPSAVNKQPWRVVVCGDRVHFYEKKDRGYDNGTYDLQKVDVGIGMYNFEEALRTAGVSVGFEIADPGIALPKDTEYIATYILN
jgi:nitroreductase